MNPANESSDNGSGPEERIIPILEENVLAGVKPVKTGSVRVEKHVETRSKKIELPLARESVEVRRLPFNKVVTEAPSVRTEGDTIIVPVGEEELVVTKRLILREEIHLIKRRTTERHIEDAPLERERVEVQRLDAQGRVMDKRSQPAKLEPNPAARFCSIRKACYPNPRVENEGWLGSLCLFFLGQLDVAFQVYPISWSDLTGVRTQNRIGDAE